MPGANADILPVWSIFDRYSLQLQETIIILTYYINTTGTIILIQFTHFTNECSERLNNLHKVAQIVSGRTLSTLLYLVAYVLFTMLEYFTHL